jgi:hypothetical protein
VSSTYSFYAFVRGLAGGMGGGVVVAVARARAAVWAAVAT